MPCIIRETFSQPQPHSDNWEKNCDSISDYQAGPDRGVFGHSSRKFPYLLIDQTIRRLDLTSPSKAFISEYYLSIGLVGCIVNILEILPESLVLKSPIKFDAFPKDTQKSAFLLDLSRLHDQKEYFA